jgi:hypothetical protein
MKSMVWRVTSVSIRRRLGHGVGEALRAEEHVVALCPLDMAHGGPRRRDRQNAAFHREQGEVL